MYPALSLCFTQCPCEVWGGVPGPRAQGQSGEVRPTAALLWVRACLPLNAHLPTLGFQSCGGSGVTRKLSSAWLGSPVILPAPLLDAGSQEAGMGHRPPGFPTMVPGMSLV